MGHTSRLSLQPANAGGLRHQASTTLPTGLLRSQSHPCWLRHHSRWLRHHTSLESSWLRHHPTNVRSRVEPSLLGHHPCRLRYQACTAWKTGHLRGKSVTPKAARRRLAEEGIILAWLSTCDACLLRTLLLREAGLHGLEASPRETCWLGVEE